MTLQLQDQTPTEQAYGELQNAYDVFNKSLFDGQLPGVMFSFVRKDSVYGYFSRGRFASVDARRSPRRADEIAMNPQLFGVQPIDEIMSTICHEMCHQWQAHFGTPSRGGYHNAEWARKMEEIGLIPSSTGRPGGARTGQVMSDYIDPEGRFAVVCARLVATGFRVSWYDRVVPAIPQHPPQPTVIEQLAAQMRNAENRIAREPVPLEGDTNWTELPGAVLDEASIVPLEHRELEVRPGAAAAGLVPNSNRVKYTCSSGEHNVWGRPGLRLACLDCGGQFDPVPEGTSRIIKGEFVRSRRRRSSGHSD